jgi:hypothetical protein
MAPGWYFKKGKPKKVFPSKYNNRPKVRGSTMTIQARVLSEQKVNRPKVRGSTMTIQARVLSEQKVKSKASEEGAAILYRDHIKPPGVYFRGEVDEKGEPVGYIIDTTVVPITIFGEYRHVPESKRPPIVNAIYRRLQVKVEELNPRRQALSYWNHITPVDERFRKLFYFFSGNEGFFVERDYIQNRIRMSRDYESSSARALIKSERWERVSWRYVEVTASVDPPD